MANDLIKYKAFLCPLEPPMVNEWKEIDEYKQDKSVGESEYTEENNLVKINMFLQEKKENRRFDFKFDIRELEKNYVDESIWYHEDKSLISWVRDSLNNINIEAYNPNDENHPCLPWWLSTIVYAKNPYELFPHAPFIFQITNNTPREKGEITNDVIWTKNITEKYNQAEDQILVRPGEYIALEWICYIKGEEFKSNLHLCKYETPLYTGGNVISTINYETPDYKVSVNIFSEPKYGLLPTDFTKYNDGKWCYLIKQEFSETPNKDAEIPFFNYGFSEVQNNDDLSENEIRQAIYNETCSYRGDVLNISSALSKAAHEHAKNMAENNFFAHEDPQGTLPEDRAKDAKYYDWIPNGYDPFDTKTPPEASVGENNHFNTYNSDIDSINHAMLGWKNSPAHNENMLKPDWTDVGIGYAEVERVINEETGETKVFKFYVQVFGYRTEQVPHDNDFYLNGYSYFRPVPFNFKGPMRTKMACSDFSIERDTEINFIEGFDAYKLHKKIESVNFFYDTGKIDGINLPIEYNCGHSALSSFERGSWAFEKDDEVIVEIPGGGTLSDGTIIGFPEKLVPCPHRMCIKVTFNGHPAIKCGQQIILEYINVNGVLKKHFSIVIGIRAVEIWGTVEEHEDFKDYVGHVFFDVPIFDIKENTRFSVSLNLAEDKITPVQYTHNGTNYQNVSTFFYKMPNTMVVGSKKASSDIYAFSNIHKKINDKMYYYYEVDIPQLYTIKCIALDEKSENNEVDDWTGTKIINLPMEHEKEGWVAYHFDRLTEEDLFNQYLDIYNNPTILSVGTTPLNSVSYSDLYGSSNNEIFNFDYNNINYIDIYGDPSNFTNSETTVLRAPYDSIMIDANENKNVKISVTKPDSELIFPYYKPIIWKKFRYAYSGRSSLYTLCEYAKNLDVVDNSVNMLTYNANPASTSVPAYVSTGLRAGYTFTMTFFQNVKASALFIDSNSDGSNPKLCATNFIDTTVYGDRCLTEYYTYDEDYERYNELGELEEKIVSSTTLSWTYEMVLCDASYF